MILLALMFSVAKAIYVINTKNITVDSGEFYVIILNTSSDSSGSSLYPTTNISIHKVINVC
jgi:hypothetical protein